MRPPPASTNRRARVAIPESRCRKLSAVRSPTSSARADPRTTAISSPGRARIAVALVRLDADAGLELAERLERDVEPGQHAVGLDEEHAARLLRGRHGRVGGDVAVADVFVERAPHDVPIERGI